MPGTRDKPLIQWSRASQREALLAALRVTERSVAEIRRDTERLLFRAQMHVRAWREAIDPDTAGWVADARVAESPISPDKIRYSLERRIEEARKTS